MKIVIPGNPVPLQRPRHTRTGITYNPQAKLMAAISLDIKNQWSYDILVGPIRIDLDYFMYIPRSLSKKRQEELNGVFHSCRPDLDNFCKFTLDCIMMSNVVFKDDSQISVIHATKVYDFNARTEIEISLL